MKKFLNLYFIEYAINALLRQKHKSGFITLVFTLLVFLLSSIFFITNSIKYELDQGVDVLPQIIVQELRAGKNYDINENRIDKILEIPGVSDVNARVWGYYYFENAGVNFTLVGIDNYENQYKSSLTKIAASFNFDDLNSSMVVGKGVKDIMDRNYYKEYFNFILPSGKIKKMNIAGVFDTKTALESNDMIVMSKQDARTIFGMAENMATDFVVKVANPSEIDTIAAKIKLLYPDTRVITKNDLKVSYQNIFDYKSGVFLALFVVAIFTFFIIIYDKASGLTSEEKKEIGILKAIGWKVDDILKEKFYEASLVSLFAYFIGIGAACGYVYFLQAPLLSNIFTGYSLLKPDFDLVFVFDIQTLSLIFFLSVPVYIAATLIPSWRVATLDADEIIR